MSAHKHTDSPGSQGNYLVLSRKTEAVQIIPFFYLKNWRGDFIFNQKPKFNLKSKTTSRS